MPDLMRFCSKWIGSTVIEQLPQGFRDKCPLETPYNKLTSVSGMHHFWKQDGEIKGRAYSDIGPVKDVAVQKGFKRTSKKKRGTKIDYTHLAVQCTCDLATTWQPNSHTQSSRAIDKTVDSDATHPQRTVVTEPPVTIQDTG